MLEGDNGVGNSLLEVSADEIRIQECNGVVKDWSDRVLALNLDRRWEDGELAFSRKCDLHSTTVDRPAKVLNPVGEPEETKFRLTEVPVKAPIRTSLQDFQPHSGGVGDRGRSELSTHQSNEAVAM